MSTTDTNPLSNDVATAIPRVVAAYREDLDQSIEWQVEPSVGDFGVGVDFASGVVTVPLTGDSHSALVRLREMVRLRSAPTDDSVYKQIAKTHSGRGVTESLIKLADHGRLNSMVRQYAEKMPTPIVIEPDGSERVLGKRLATANSPMSWDKCVEYAAVNAGTKGFDQFVSGINSVNRDWAKTLKKIASTMKVAFNEDVASLGSTTQVNWGDGVMGPESIAHSVWAASQLAEYMSKSYRAPQTIREQIEEKETERANNYGEADPDDLLKGYGEIDPSSQLDTSELPADFEFKTDPDDVERPDEYFGPLIWNDSMPLTTQVTGYMARKRRADTTGRVFSYPQRWYTDDQKRAFGRKTRVRGGVVVLDISGSMHMSEQDINDILEVAPAALIMAYSDCDNGNGEPNAHLLAKRGWRVKEFVDVHRGGNGVDGTALTWAIRHKKHGEDIIWVSDGQVFGIGGYRNDNLAVQCAKLVKKHRIIMIPSMQAAVAAFKSGRPMRQFNRPTGPIREALLGHYN
jgi:hypothetical protein